ncbi:uncharacterized protein LOC119109734 [Pollicipes pollicipes]|uniref:uncharacterized protein LOC119109734 n=1 Tax=Pollicipes pollicipes TaxID=41117 RepID=UPI0018852938|nr:uncharacterized protein LOC119109734 [Pollicipes pollicipes]
MAAERCLLAAALLLAVALAGAGPVAAPQPTDTVGSSGAGSEQDKNGRQAAAGSGADDAGTGSSDTQTQLGTGQAQTDQAEAKFYDLNGTTRVFFNYGVTLTALIYGLMGVSYFYGPYSKEALAARRRAEQRIQHLKLKLGKDDVGEVDYGYFTEEAAAGDGGYAGEDYGYDRVGEGAPPPASWTDDGRYPAGDGPQRSWRR